MKLEVLRDGTPVALREPTPADVHAVQQFFEALPTEDKRYLRVDMTRDDVVQRMIEEAIAGQAYRKLALIDNRVVAHGALRFSQESWHRHLGEIRVMVAPEFRNRNLGGIMIRHLFQEAKRREIDKVTIKIAGPQTALRERCERYGFAIDAVLPEHIKDREGKLHPLVVMSCPLDSFSRAVRDINAREDWPDG